jgi:hypothetical protein
MRAPLRILPIAFALAALWAEGCSCGANPPPPSGSPDLTMPAAAPARPSASAPPLPTPAAAPEISKTEPAPPRPPLPIPDAAPAPADAAASQDGLSAAFNAAKKETAASRAQPQFPPLLSLSLKQLLGPSGRGVHLLTALKIKAADGAEYRLSAQSSRLGVDPATGYVVFARDGMRAPVLVDLRSLKLSGLAGLAAGGSVDQVDVEGRKFGIILDPSMSDANCKNKPMSEVRVWPQGDEARTVKFTISAAFAAAFAAAAGRFHAGSVDVAVVAYQDVSGGASVAFLVAEPLGGLQQIPVDLLARADGKAVSVPVPNVSLRLGARVTGAGADQVLEVYDLAKVPALGVVPLESLAKLGCR